jgi:putative ABC transport system permease protein
MGSILSALRLALVAILRHKTRSLLTVLGILIGVAAVVMVTALSSAATSKVGGQIESFAANAIFVSPRPTQQHGARRNGRLTDADARAIAREAVSVVASAPFLQTMTQVVRGEKNAATTVIGTTLPYFDVRRFEIARGALWSETDELLKTKVCVIGPVLAKKLFGPTEDPVGQLIRIGRAPYRVIGLLKERGTSPFGEDQDDRIAMPIGSYRARVSYTWQGRADLVMASARNEEVSDRAIRQITSILRQRHRLPDLADDDFRVSSQADLLKAQRAISGALSALLLGVAAVSLVVGGVGVMNIMLVSVSERTREIGIRMSIGAREGDILWQFLVEAVALSLGGGLLGGALGAAGAYGLGFALDWPVIPTAGSMLVALGTSAVIGIVFGYLPARRAAQMDPIDALRVE